MSNARVEAIYIGPTKGAPLRGVHVVRAVPGAGLEGDRYWQGGERPATKRGPDREATLIEAEAIEALHRDFAIELNGSESRRNLVTRGVALNDLVGREFQVGNIRLRGIRLCDPCTHLEKLTRPGVLKGLTNRGGLRAEILTEGELHVGDAIQVGLGTAD